MKKEIKNIPASIHQKLLNKAKETNRHFNELLQYYAVERFLYRISQSEYKDKIILKGAMMFVAWHALYTRATRDIDMLGKFDNNVSKATEMIKDVCGLSFDEDGMVYDSSSVAGEQIIEDGDYKGVRIKLIGNLGNAKTVLQIDFGFGDTVFPKPENIEYPTILDMPSPNLKGYPKETVIAEKLHVMINRGIINSRMKDFYDVWLLAEQFDFDSATLGEAIQKTFKHRQTNIELEPEALSDEFSANEDKNIQWKAFLKKQSLEHAPKEFKAVVKSIREFINPVLRDILTDKGIKHIWKAPGPWKKA